MRTTFPNFILLLDFEQFLAFLAKYFVFVYRLGAVEVAANARENLNCDATFELRSDCRGLELMGKRQSHRNNNLLDP